MSPLPTPDHCVTTDQLTQDVMSGCQEKITRHIKKQETQFTDAKQVSEPDTDTIGILESSNQGIKTILIKMPCDISCIK